MRYTLAILIIILLASSAFPKAGQPIPVPQVSINEAIKIASDEFNNTYVNVGNKQQSKYMSERILVSATYKNEHLLDKFGEWLWVIVFLHPISNDHQIHYTVDNYGIAEEIIHTV